MALLRTSSPGLHIHIVGIELSSCGSSLARISTCTSSIHSIIMKYLYLPLRTLARLPTNLTLFSARISVFPTYMQYDHRSS